MLRLLVLALALAVPALAAKLPYIIGGDPVGSATKWPWQCSLGYYNGNYYSHSCGAAVISNTWLATAAHCISSPTNKGVRCGTVYHKSGGVLRYVNRVYVHENYGTGAGSLPNDVAVIQVDALPLSSTIKAITMATTDQSGNSNCWITGWGYTTISNGPRPLPNQLQEAKINVYTNSYCKSKDWGSSINNGHVCVGTSTRGSCNGDSGGPLVCKVSGEYQLLGVTSWGNRDCSPTDLSVYTRIPYFRSWIRGKTGI